MWIDATDMMRWTQRKTGVQRVIHDLISTFCSISDTRLFYFSQVSGMFLEVNASDYFEYEGIREHDLPSRRSRLHTRTGPALMRTTFRPARFRHGDTILVPGGDWRRRGFLKRLGTLQRERRLNIHHFVHDVMPITMPHLFPECETVACLSYLRGAFAMVDSIITSSIWNIGDITSLMEREILPRRAVHAVGLGTTTLRRNEVRRPRLTADTDEFVLTVGTFELKKNRRLIYGAYKLAKRADIELPKLVIAGQPGGIPDEGVRLLTHDPDLRGQVQIVRNPSDGEIRWLYEASSYTIFPSLCEGWGIPIDESLSFGKPCLTTDTSAMREVGGSSADYLDPYSAHALLDLMRSALDTCYLQRRGREIAEAYRPRQWSDVCMSIEHAVEGGS